MKHEAWVYKWTNKTLGKSYLGYHKHYGNTDDGYICSSQSQQFWDDWDNEEYNWEREIIFEGDQKECIDLEYKLLTEADIDDKTKWYNNVAGKHYVMTDDIRGKMSDSAAREYWLNSMYSDEPIEKITNLYQFCVANGLSYTRLHRTVDNITAAYVDGMYLTRADGDYTRDKGRGNNMHRTNNRHILKTPVQAEDGARQIRYDNYVQAIGCMWSDETDPTELILVDIDTKEDVTNSIINNRTDYGFYKNTNNCFVLSKTAYKELLDVR